jgi:hypothetical protein
MNEQMNGWMDGWVDGWMDVLRTSHEPGMFQEPWIHGVPQGGSCKAPILQMKKLRHTERALPGATAD